jgi:Radical SAM superfamily
MPSFLSGVRGGIEGKASADSRIALLKHALEGCASEDDILAAIRKSEAHHGITFVINNACNLACRHCYLQVDKLTSDHLTVDESKQLLSSALDRQPDLICLSGKEVFLGNRGSELLTWLTSARDSKSPATRIGVITNGTLLHLHREAVLASDLDYIDISVDGVREDHDYNRGEGAYDRMLPNLKWAVRHLPDRVFVNMTLQQRNFRRYTQAIAELHEAGVRTIGCSFYHQLPYTDTSLELGSEDYDSILTSLHSVGQIPLRQHLTVLVEVDLLSLPAMLAFFRSDWFDPSGICVDDHGEFYCEHILGNGACVQVRFSPFPLLIHKSVRITPEGNYLAAEDTVNTRLYAANSLGNIREFGFDLSSLHAHAAAAPRLNEITLAYFRDALPQLQLAYKEALHGSNSDQPPALIPVMA